MEGREPSEGVIGEKGRGEWTRSRTEASQLVPDTGYSPVRLSCVGMLPLQYQRMGACLVLSDASLFSCVRLEG